MIKSPKKNKMCIGLLLAAGRGERFSSSIINTSTIDLRTPKLLQPIYNNTTVFEASLKKLCSAFEVVFVVTLNNSKLIKIANHYKAIPVINETPEKGMSHSLHLGSKKIKQYIQNSEKNSFQGVVIALADMPALLPNTILRISNELTQVENDIIPPDKRIVRPVYRDRESNLNKEKRIKQYGHPVGFGLSYLTQLEQQTGDKGARVIIKQHSNNVITLPCSDKGILLDIDTPEMLLEVREYLNTIVS